MNELSDQTKALLARYRQAPAIDDGAKRALWSRVGASVADQAEATDSPPKVVSIDRWRSAGRIAVGLAAVAAVLLLIRTVAHSSWVQQTEQVPTSEQAVYGRAESGAPSKAIERTAPRRTSASSAAETPRPTPEPTPAVTPPAPARVSTARTNPSTPPRPATEPKATASASELAAPPNSLAEEMRLMTAARRALSQGQPARALELLEQHERTHARGQMAEDRAALRSQALCEAGRGAEARAAATSFLAAHPRSAHGNRVRATLDRATKENCTTR
ncbi:MAG: hypothetical protein AAF799_47480 [Myxococcota bacterium]